MSSFFSAAASAVDLFSVRNVKFIKLFAETQPQKNDTWFMMCSAVVKLRLWQWMIKLE